MLIKPITTKALADAAGLSVATVRRLERRGVLRATRDFRGWRAFSPAEVERLQRLLGWVQGNEAAMADEPARGGVD
jgi:DNA-binding transcriptional MerR regulator